MPTISIRPAAVDDLPGCLPLTFRALHPLLQAACAPPPDVPALDHPPLALIATAPAAPGLLPLGLPPLGLALIGPSPAKPGNWQLHSLVVRRDARRRGIGRALLEALRTHPRAGAPAPMLADWSDHLPGAAAFAATLRAAGWQAPRPALLRLQSPAGNSPVLFTRRDAMLARARRAGISVTAWPDLPADRQHRFLDRAAVWLADGTLPDWADPSACPDTLACPFSLTLHHDDGEPVGWILCRPQPELNRWLFLSGWVRPEHAPRGTLMLLLAEVCDRMHRTIGPHAIAAFETAPTITGMWAILEKHFKPLTYLEGLTCDTLLESWRTAPPTEPAP